MKWSGSKNLVLKQRREYENASRTDLEHHSWVVALSSGNNLIECFWCHVIEIPGVNNCGFCRRADSHASQTSTRKSHSRRSGDYNMD